MPHLMLLLWTVMILADVSDLISPEVLVRVIILFLYGSMESYPTTWRKPEFNETFYENNLLTIVLIFLTFMDV